MSRPLFLGNEASVNPAIEDLLRVARALVEEGAGEGALSARHGLRATMSLARPLEALGAKDFVEVADYDPHTDHVLVLGPSEPHAHAPLHALVLRAKKEIGAIVHLTVPPDHPALARLPLATRGRTALDHALSVLELLRAAPVVAPARAQVLATGRSIEEAHANLRAALAGADAGGAPKPEGA